MLKLLNRFLILAIVLFLGFAVYYFSKFEFKNPFGIKSIETTHNIILEKTKALGKLELATYYFKDIVEQTLERDYLPDPKALIIVYGEATGCIDLTRLTIDDIKSSNDTIYIRLPQAELCQYKIDHSKTHIYDASNAFMNEKLLFEEAYKSAEKKIKSAALDAGILSKTEANAELILLPILQNITQKPIVLSIK